MISLEQIQNNIIEALKQSDMKQIELAEKIGVKQAQISCYLHGKKLPALDTFANICAVLNLDPIELLDLNNYETK